MPLRRSSSLVPACASRVAAILLLGMALAWTGTARAGDESIPVDPALKPLEPWLTNEDWTVRSMAAFELRKRSEEGVVRLAAQMLATEKHPYPAAAALGALRGRPRRELVMEGGPLLVGALLRFARHRHPTVSAYAREVLQVVPPVKLGTELDRYEGWWRRGEAALAREQEALRKAHARVTKTAADLMGDGDTTSVAPKDDFKEFYGRIESMRKDGLELCIVMDDTGSMSQVIARARHGARSLVDRLCAYVPNFRTAVVTYKDSPYFRAGMTRSPEVLTKAFKFSASGGGDIPEGVDKGIRMAIKDPRIAWSRSAYRVVIVVGDAPPHAEDVPRLQRMLYKQKDDLLFEHPVVVHTIATSRDDIPEFELIAAAGNGSYLKLSAVARLVDALVVLSFGGKDAERVRTWMKEIDALRAAAKDASK